MFAVFIPRRIICLELGQTFVVLLVMLFCIKTSTRRIIRLDELSFEILLERHTTRDRGSSRRIIRLVPFILEKHNQTNYKCLSKFVQTDKASSV